MARKKHKKQALVPMNAQILHLAELSIIYSFLPAQDACSHMRVNKHMHAKLYNSDLFETYLLRDFKLAQFPSEFDHGYDAYRQHVEAKPKIYSRFLTVFASKIKQ